MQHRLIGHILMENTGLSQQALEHALRIQQEKGGRIGEILMEQKAITELDLLKALSVQLDLSMTLSLSPEEANTGFAQKVPIHFLKKYRMVPVITPQQTMIAVNDPLLFQPVDDLRGLLDLDSTPVVLSPYSAILSVINFAYDMSGGSAEQVIQDMHGDETSRILSEIEETADLLEDTSDAPIIKLVNLMLSQAVKARASDIHIEPSQQRLKIRYRVDGLLYDMLSPPKHVQSALISRVKIMAKMNIAEKRLPQDGRIEIRIADRSVDIRVSTIPTAHGERVVL
ncbi:MAG: GspE/PulE family protein, partial [Desulfobacteraceae bacterium]